MRRLISELQTDVRVRSATSLAPLSEVTHTLMQPNSTDTQRWMPGPTTINSTCRNQVLEFNETTQTTYRNPKYAATGRNWDAWMLEVPTRKMAIHRPPSRCWGDARQRGLIVWSKPQTHLQVRLLCCVT